MYIQGVFYCSLHFHNNCECCEKSKYNLDTLINT